MTIKERFLAEETKIGKILSKWIGMFLLLCSGVGALTELLITVPPEIIPSWFRAVVFIAGAISFVAGKMTVKKE